MSDYDDLKPWARKAPTWVVVAFVIIIGFPIMVVGALFEGACVTIDDVQRVMRAKSNR